MPKSTKDAIEAVETESKSLRDDIADAFDGEEEEVKADEQVGESQEASGEQEAAGEIEEKQDDSQDDDDVHASGDGDNSDTTDSASGAGDDELGKKPPIDWPPKAREQWLKLPQDVRAQITKRERDIAVALQGTSEAKKTHSSLTELARQYKPIMDAEGVSDPMQAVSGLFQTVAQLRVGTPEQKAVKMAHLINHYGIDVQALDSALAGQPIATPEEQKLSSIIDEKMAPVNDLLSQLQQRQHHATQQSQLEAEKAVSEFQGEFLSDVRMDMADLIDMAAQRGQNMTLQDAYDKAVLLRPDIQAVLTERKQKADLLDQEAALQNKRDASSSITGKQHGTTQIGGGSLRDEIESAWGETDRI